MKNRFKVFWQKIYRHLGFYIFGIILVPLITLTCVYYKTRTQETEKFALFFTTDSLETETLYKELAPLIYPYGIKEENHYVSSIASQSEEAYFNDLEAYGISLSDFMVVPSSVATESFLASYTVYFKDYYEDGISYNKKTYALRVYNHETKIGYHSDIINYELTEEDYYLCISKNSFQYDNYLANSDSVLLTYINWMIK